MRPCSVRRVLLPSLGLVSCALALPGRAEVVDSSPSGFTIQNEARVPVDTEATWKALVEDVDRWWPRDHTWWGSEGALSIEPRAGGCFCERHADKQALHMLVTFVDPGKLLRLSGGLGPLQGMGLHGVLEFRLAEAEGGGTTITLFHRAGGYAPDDLGAFAAVVDRVQAQQLGGLAAYLREATAAR